MSWEAQLAILGVFLIGCFAIDEYFHGIDKPK